MWVRHPSFLPLVASSWGVPLRAPPLARLAFQLIRLKMTLKTWNDNTFGNVHSNVSLAEKEVVHLEQL